VQVNPAQGGPGALADAQAALDALSRGSGLRFVYDGTTTFVPSSNRSAAQPADVVIAWAPPGTGPTASDYYQSGDGPTRGSLLLHELAHVAGLGHTDDGTQVMYPMLRSSSVGSFGAGDLAGLAAVGAGKGCTASA
jgi:hypothetical protein